MRKIILLLLWIFTAIVFARPALSQDGAVEHISSFAGEYRIQPDGTVNVVESIEYFFPTERHGIFRTIPLIKTNEQGEEFRIEISDVGVTNAGGEPWIFQTSTSNGEFEIKIGDPNTYVRDVQTYNISYTVSGALTYFNDHDELYWNVTGDEWEVPIYQASAQVFLNDYEQLPANTRGVCYTGNAGSTAQDCNVQIQSGSIGFQSLGQLLPGEGLTLVFGFPPGLVSQLEPEKVVSFWDTFQGKLLTVFLLGVAFMWYIVLPFVVIYLWWRNGRDPVPPGGAQDVSAFFDPPKDSQGYQLRAAEAGTVIDETVQTSEMSAMIIQLAQEGYLKIREYEKGRYSLLRLDKETEQLQYYESKFIQEVFKEGDEVEFFSQGLLSSVKKALDKHDFPEPKYHTMYETLQDDLYSFVVQKGYFVKNPNSVRANYAVFVVAAMFTFNLPLAIILSVASRHMPRKTLSGVKVAAQARSLKRFLDSQERQLNFQGDKKMLFEKLLPFAITFGVEKHWIERFKDLYKQPPSWIETQSATWSAMHFTNSMQAGINSSSRPPSSSSSGFSSGFSGGSSGGGGGGGGGGSW